MKMVFFSADRVEVEMLSKELMDAGIHCEVRSGIELEDVTAPPPEAELWVKEDKDCHDAFMFCVRRDLGFAKHGALAPTIDEICEKREAEAAEEAAAEEVAA